MRHIMQVGFTDRLIGEMMNHLKDNNLYDNSVIIITADHGVSFSRNKQRRAVSVNNASEILSVPLFIKGHNQKKGVIIDKNVATIDIIPTLSDILKIPLPWRVDGRSAIKKDFIRKKIKVYTNYIVNFGKTNGIFRPVTDKALLQASRSKTKRFGRDLSFKSITHIGPETWLIGKSLDSLKFIDSKKYFSKINNKQNFLHIERDSDFLPCQISGKIWTNRNRNRRFSPDILIAINGKVAGTAPSKNIAPGKAEFFLIVDEDSFKNGKNDIAAFLIKREKEKLELFSCKNAP